MNRPFAAGFGASSTPVCHAMRTVSGLVLEAETSVAETACVSMGAATCRFRARSKT